MRRRLWRLEERRMVIAGIVGFAGVVVCGVLYVVFFFKGISLKIPLIGMAVFALAIAAAILLPRFGITLPGLPDASGELPGTAESEDPGDGSAGSLENSNFPQVLLDKRGLVITATGLDEAGPHGPVLSLSIENRSETDVTVEVRDASVNGWMMDTAFSVAASAGQTSDGSVLFLASRMQRSGIDAIADLEFRFHILDRNRVAFLDSDAITIRTSAADTGQSPLDGLGEELYNGSGVRIISGGLSGAESTFGPGLALFLENSTDRAVTVQARDVFVNGLRADAIFSEDVLPGKRSAAAVTLIGVSPDHLSELSFTLRVADRELRTTLFDTEPFTVRADGADGLF